MRSFMLVMLIYVVSFGQKNKSQDPKNKALAQQLYKTYHKFGLQTGLSLLFVENEKNAVELEYTKPRSFEIGLTYNFFQIKNFNFNSSLVYRNFNLRNFQNLSKEEINAPFDDTGYLTIGPNNQFKLGLSVEYYFNLFKKTSVFFGLGPEFTFARKTYGFSGSLSYADENGIRRGYTANEDYNKSFFIGANICFGVNLKTKPILFQPFITYHYQPENLFTKTVTTQNLLVSENTVSKHQVTGNYILFGLKIIPSKKTFSSKKELN